jgi:hypothetical protein
LSFAGSSYQLVVVGIENVPLQFVPVAVTSSVRIRVAKICGMLRRLVAVRRRDSSTVLRRLERMPISRNISDVGEIGEVFVFAALGERPQRTGVAVRRPATTF